MDINKKLSQFDREQKAKELLLIGGTAAAFVIALVLMFFYFSGEREHSEITGIVKAIVAEESETSTSYTASISLSGGDIILVSVSHISRVHIGGKVVIRKTVNTKNGKVYYLFLRSGDT